MKILIVGAGIGGLTLASFLKNSSIEYDIIEKASAVKGQGYSLCIWNNGRRILEKLGLAEKFDSLGCRVDSYCVRDGKGKILRNYNLSKFYSEYGMAFVNIERTDLHHLLAEFVGEERIQFNTFIDKIHQYKNKVQVTFNTGKIEEYDLVVGADGIHSDIRSKIFGDNIEKFDDWRVWYAWVDNSFKEKNTVTEYIGPGEFVGLFGLRDKTLITLIAPANHTSWDNIEGRHERLKNIFKEEEKIKGIFDTLKDSDFMPTDFSNIRIKNFVKDRVVLLGDAAHGFEPYAGIGASMAMEDGYVLAGELLKVSDNYKLKEALSYYQMVRKKRVKKARNLTNTMRAWYSIKSRFLRKIVNAWIPFFPINYILNKYHKILREEI